MSTSLSLTDEDLADEIRDCEGDNNAERLRNWARNFEEEEEDSIECSRTEEEIKDLAEERLIELQRSR